MDAGRCVVVTGGGTAGYFAVAVSRARVDPVRGLLHLKWQGRRKRGPYARLVEGVDPAPGRSIVPARPSLRGSEKP